MDATLVGERAEPWRACQRLREEVKGRARETGCLDDVPVTGLLKGMFCCYSQLLLSMSRITRAWASYNLDVVRD